MESKDRDRFLVRARRIIDAEWRQWLEEGDRGTDSAMKNYIRTLIENQIKRIVGIELAFGRLEIKKGSLLYDAVKTAATAAAEDILRDMKFELTPKETAALRKAIHRSYVDQMHELVEDAARVAAERDIAKFAHDELGIEFVPEEE